MENEIKTNFNPPPIPDRNYDWAAYREYYDEGDDIGYGPTKEAAIASLLELEELNNESMLNFNTQDNGEGNNN